MNEQNPSQSASYRAMSGAGSQFILQLVGQLIALFITRELLSTFSIAENGVFAFIQKSGTLVFTLLVDAGMINFAIRYVVESPGETKSIVATLFKLRLALWAIVTTVLLACSSIIAPEYTMPLFLWSVFFLLAGKLGLLRTALETVYRVNAHFVLISVLALVDTIILMALLLADLRELNIHNVMVWYLLSSIPGFLILFVKARGWEILAEPFSKVRARQLIIDILPFVGTTVLLHINSYSETLLLSLFGTMEDVGVFEALGRIVIPMFMIINSLLNGIYPFVVQFQKDDIERCKQYVFYGFKISTVVSLLIALCIITTIPWIISFFTGGRYANSVDEFALYSWLIIPNFSYNYVLAICLAIGLQKRTTSMAAVLTIAELIVAPILISHFMVDGAVIAKLFSNVLGWWVSIRILTDFFQDNRMSVFLKKFIPVSIVLLGIGTCSLVMQLPVPASIALVLTIFVILMIVSRIVDADDYRLMQSFTRSVMNKFGIQRR